MLNYLEEFLSARTFSANTISEKTIDMAQSVIDNAYSLCSSPDGRVRLSHLYSNINSLKPDSDQHAATYIVAAAIYLCGRTWKIFENTYTWNIVPRKLQIAAALELCKKDKRTFAVQPTGEGKTITALIAIAILARRGSVHVITANDYLASRDYQWIGPVLDVLGIKSTFLDKCITCKSNCYSTSVVFGSDKEFLFDYLRDSMRPHDLPRQCMVRENVLVDEGDHILLDELMTPAIISKEQPDSNPYRLKADTIVRNLNNLQDNACSSLLGMLNSSRFTLHSKEQLSAITALRYSGKMNKEMFEFFEQKRAAVIESERFEFKMLMKNEEADWYAKHLYFIVNHQEKSCVFTDRGMDYIEKELGQSVFTLPECYNDNDFDVAHYQLLASLQSALIAYTLLKRDIDYIIRDSKIEVITTSIGRADSLKRFRHDLSGAVAIKEQVEYDGDSLSVTRSTIAAFIKEYQHCAILSGTLLPDHTDFEKIYNIRAFHVPFDKVSIVRHQGGKIYQDSSSKLDAILKEVLYFHSFGRPILIGTNSIINSEAIAGNLIANGVLVRILCAKNEEEESGIIAQAGGYGSVTVATNMAGRGCDINVPKETERRICHTFAEYLKDQTSKCNIIYIQCESKYESEILCNQLIISGISYETSIQQQQLSTFKVQGKLQTGTVTLKFGLGLHVIISECCTSRRIEMQLRGRTGRQGNPGSSSLFISLQDDALVAVPSVRWLGMGINRWFGHPNHPILMRFFLWMINLATEGNQRFFRDEQLFFDSVSETYRKRVVELREKAIESESHDLFCRSITIFIEYLNEELLFIDRYESRISFVISRLRTVFSLHELQFPNQLLDKRGTIDQGVGAWLTGLLTTRNVRIPKKDLLALFCSCLDDTWATFAAALECYWEQAHLFAFSGRDPKTTFIDITFSKWHEAVFAMYENFLLKLYIFVPDFKEKIKLRTNFSDNELETLLTR